MKNSIKLLKTHAGSPFQKRKFRSTMFGCSPCTVLASHERNESNQTLKARKANGNFGAVRLVDNGINVEEMLEKCVLLMLPYTTVLEKDLNA